MLVELSIGVGTHTANGALQRLLGSARMFIRA
jgi:hypothetical protein